MSRARSLAMADAAVSTANLANTGEEGSVTATVGQDTAMSSQDHVSPLAAQAFAAFGARLGPAQDLAEHAADIVAAAYAMALRFHLGGKLMTFGIGAASTDASHVAVEFVHPVI